MILLTLVNRMVLQEGSIKFSAYADSLWSRSSLIWSRSSLCWSLLSLCPLLSPLSPLKLSPLGGGQHPPLALAVAPSRAVVVPPAVEGAQRAGVGTVAAAAHPYEMTSLDEF